MPSLDIEINSGNLPFSCYASGTTSSYVLPNFQTWYSGYPELFLKEKRVTTNRNSIKLTGVKLRTCLPPPRNEWYSSKPQRSNFDDSDFDYQNYLVAKKKWLASKPSKAQKAIFSPNWQLVQMDNGKKALVVNQSEVVNGLNTLRWEPLLESRLRPVNRPWYRHSTHLPLNARVNDLLYYKQTGYQDGWVDAVFTDIPNGNVSADYVNDNNLKSPAIGGCITGVVHHHGSALEFPWVSNGFSGCPFGDFTPSVDAEDLMTTWGTEIDELSKLALSRHYQKLKNQKVDLATELSQGLLTVNMIGDLAKRIASVLLHLKKGQFFEAFRKLFPTTRKGIANDYLVWQYGLKPLIGDLKGAAEHLAEFLQRSAPVKSNGHAKQQFTQSTNETIGFLSRTVSSTAEIRVKYGSSFKLSDKLTRQAAQLGFTNPKAVIWELVPFSFVIDWFLTVGDFLGNLTALDGLEIDESYKTVFIRNRTVIVDYIEATNSRGAISEYPSKVLSTDFTDFPGTSYWFIRYGYHVTVRETTFCKRVVLPLPGVPSPRFKNPISRVHINNALALISQLIK